MKWLRMHGPLSCLKRPGHCILFCGRLIPIASDRAWWSTFLGTGSCCHHERACVCLSFAYRCNQDSPWPINRMFHYQHWGYSVLTYPIVACTHPSLAGVSIYIAPLYVRHALALHTVSAEIPFVIISCHAYCCHCGNCIVILQMQSANMTIFLWHRHLGPGALDLICCASNFARSSPYVGYCRFVYSDRLWPPPGCITATESSSCI